MPPEQQCTIALCFSAGADRRRYNLPTSAGANEVAVILPGDGDQPTDCRDIILHRRAGQPFDRIDELHPLYHPLRFVLLFPTGQLGWHTRIPFQGVNVNHPPADVQDAPGQEENPEQGAPSKKRLYISQTEYFHYRIHPRFEESDHFFRSRRLFQEFAVDSWAASEQNRLNWVRFHQNDLRVDS